MSQCGREMLVKRYRESLSNGYQGEQGPELKEDRFAASNSPKKPEGNRRLRSRLYGFVCNASGTAREAIPLISTVESRISKWGSGELFSPYARKRASRSCPLVAN